jgi:hypothetical protein
MSQVKSPLNRIKSYFKKQEGQVPVGMDPKEFKELKKLSKDKGAMCEPRKVDVSTRSSALYKVAMPSWKFACNFMFLLAYTAA